MKNIIDIAKEQGIDIITKSNIDDVLLASEEDFIKVKKGHMHMIVLYFLTNFKEYYPKEYVKNIVETGRINNLFGIKLILDK